MNAMMNPAQFDALSRIDFFTFIRRVFNHLHGHGEYTENFHVPVIAARLEGVRRGEDLRFAICLPPRGLKSVVISVAYVAWLLGHDPSLKIICVSYNQELADKMASDCRNIMHSLWYRKLFAGTTLAPGRQSLAAFETTKGGGRFSTSVGGTITGFGADYIIVDDPMKPLEALSDVERVKINDWIRHSLFTRLNDKQRGRIVIVMQRLHGDDPVGVLTQAEGESKASFSLLSFPAIAIEDEEYVIETPVGRQVFIRKEGEALDPIREPLSVLHRVKQEMTHQFFAAQYQQTPVAPGGNILKRDWISFYSPEDLHSPERIIQSWDTASKTSELNDWSVCTTWAIQNRNHYLLDVWRERLDMPGLRRAVMDLALKFQPSLVLMEDASSGIGLIQDLRASGFHKVRPVKPQGHKLFRFSNALLGIEHKTVHFPKSAPWLDAYVEELCTFPNGRFDDQVDSTSQALLWLVEQVQSHGIIEYYRQLVEAKNSKAAEDIWLMKPPELGRTVYLRDGTKAMPRDDGHFLLPQSDAVLLISSGFVRIL
tara:strand:+ start:3030 stop:4649 length:1620 start_codon:yes stop_codon:yes gene_type:complete